MVLKVNYYLYYNVILVIILVIEKKELSEMVKLVIGEK